jgi:hypothetical protein
MKDAMPAHRATTLKQIPILIFFGAGCEETLDLDEPGRARRGEMDMTQRGRF